jgi:Uma2 family endonuclease
MRTYAPPEIDYPDDDGLPRSESQLQLEWMFKVQGCLGGMFLDDPNIFIGGNLLWYPVKGDNTTRRAPDVMVAFGRPRDDYRGSYRQWEEGEIAPQVVFEILAPTMDDLEIENKFQFYERHGVEEYYVIDPDRVEFRGWLRGENSLVEIRSMAGWVSPRLGIRFEVGDDLTILDPNGRPFLSYADQVRRTDEAEQRTIEAARRRIEFELQAAEAERRRADVERLQAEAERNRAEAERRRVAKECHRANVERQIGVARQQAERLRDLGLDPEE